MKIYLITKRPQFFSWYNLICESNGIQLIPHNWNQSFPTRYLEDFTAIIVDPIPSEDQQLTTVIQSISSKKIPILLLNNCDYNRLLHFINSLFQRASTLTCRNIIEITPDIFFDPDAHCLIKRGEILNLTPIEYRLLNIMSNDLDRVFTPDELLDAVWGFEKFTGSNTLYVHIHKLRKKIEKKPSKPSILITQRGHEYVLKKSENSSPNYQRIEPPETSIKLSAFY